MSACCVPGCKNRHSSTSKLKFYRIPRGKRPFQANRRRLWLRAIQEAKGSTGGITGGITGNARICGAHFVSGTGPSPRGLHWTPLRLSDPLESRTKAFVRVRLCLAGEASLDHDSPDFVPSVFTCCKPNPTPRKKVRRSYGCRRRRRPRATGKTAPPDDHSVDIQSFACLESESELPDLTKTTSDPSLPKEGEQLTEDVGTTSSTKDLAEVLKGKLSPVVVLKPVVAPAGGFQCELCIENFVSVSELVKHKQVHEEEKKIYICDVCGKRITGQADFVEHQQVHTEETFPCNMCDRFFTTSHNLKRHKLRHVRDGRKCPSCGVLFCRRHNHILYLPRPDSVSETEQECSSIQPQNSNPMSENSLQKNCISSETPAPKPEKSFSLPHPPLPKRRYKPTSFRPPLSNPPVAFTQPPVPKHPELPDSLQVFSPQYLTSALLEVQRNYEYILSKPEKEVKVELPLISPDEQSIRKVKKERIAYDMEIVL